MGLCTGNCTVASLKMPINKSVFYVHQFVWWTEHDYMIDCATVKWKWYTMIENVGCYYFTESKPRFRRFKVLSNEKVANLCFIVHCCNFAFLFF